MVAPPNRLVVDKSDFEKQIARKIKEQVDVKAGEEIDKTIDQLKKDTDAFFQRERMFMQVTLQKNVLKAIRDTRDSMGDDDSKEAMNALMNQVKKIFLEPTPLELAQQNDDNNNNAN